MRRLTQIAVRQLPFCPFRPSSPFLPSGPLLVSPTSPVIPGEPGSPGSPIPPSSPWSPLSPSAPLLPPKPVAPVVVENNQRQWLHQDWRGEGWRPSPVSEVWSGMECFNFPWMGSQTIASYPTPPLITAFLR